jgi:hypothetical protein
MFQGHVRGVFALILLVSINAQAILKVRKEFSATSARVPETFLDL